MHPNRGADNSVQILLFIRLVSFWTVFCLDRIYLTLYYEIVLHLFLPEVEVPSVEHKSSRLRILVDSISNADFEEPIIDSVPIILANPVSRDCNDERDGADWSSQIS